MEYVKIRRLNIDSAKSDERNKQISCDDQVFLAFLILRYQTDLKIVSKHCELPNN